MIFKKMAKSHITLLFIIGYLLIYMSPLLNFNNLVGQSGDPYAYLWQMEFFCSRLLTFDYTSLAFYPPIGVNFAGGYYMPLLNLLVCPFNAFGPTAMLNLIVLFQVIFISVVFYFFIYLYISKNKILQISFSLLYIMSGFFLNRILGHFDIISFLWTMPLIVISWDMIRRNKLPYYLLLGISYGFSITSSWQNIVLLTPVTIIGIFSFFYSIIKKKYTRKEIFRIILMIFLSAFIFAAITLPLAFPMINYKLITKSDFSFDLNIARYRYSSDISSLLFPSEHGYMQNIFNSYASYMREKGLIIFESHSPLDPLSFIVLICILFFILLNIVKSKFTKNIRISTKIIKLLIISLMYFILSFWSSIKLLGIPILNISYLETVYSVFPFSLSRTPGRQMFGAYFFASIACFIFISTFVLNIKNRVTKKIVIYSILVYSIIWTIFIQQNYFISNHNFLNNIPVDGLNIIKNNTENIYVLPIPITPASDPKNTLIQLYHSKPQMSGYISSWITSPEMLKSISDDWYFSRLGCDEFNFENIVNGSTDSPNFLNNWSNVSTHLKENKIKYIVINYEFLNRKKECSALVSYIENLINQDMYFKIINETETYLIIEILK